MVVGACVSSKKKITMVTLHHNSRVSDQNGVSLLYIMLKIHHSAWEPRIYLGLRLNEPPAKGRVWNGLPRLAHSHAQSSAAKTSVDLLSWARRSQWE